MFGLGYIMCPASQPPGMPQYDIEEFSGSFIVYIGASVHALSTASNQIRCCFDLTVSIQSNFRIGNNVKQSIDGYEKNDTKGSFIWL